MKILIVGCNGFIGHHTYNHFNNKDNYSVIGCDIFTNYDKINFKLISTHDDAFVELFKQNKFDICINASGMANVAFSFEKPFDDYIANVYNIIKLLDTIRQYAPLCKYINLSSAAVYGNPLVIPVKETDLEKPISVYGYHKLQSEMLCEEYYKIYGISTVSLRLFSVFGEGLKKQLFWDLHHKIQQESSILSLYGSPDDSRDYIYIEDLMEVFNKIILNAEFKSERINIANGHEILLDDIAKDYINITGMNKTIEYTNTSLPGYPSKWKADISKLKELGYKPKTEIKEGLIKYYLWVKQLK